MARVEIDEAELASMRQEIGGLRGIGQAVEGMLKNPRSRPMLLQARKMADPNASVPEIDAAAPMMGELDKFRNELAEERKARAAEKAEAEQQKAIEKAEREIAKQEEALRTQGWNTEGLAAVRKHAEERGIFDLEAAAAHYEKLHPPPDPAQPNGFGNWGFFDNPEADDDFVKKMIDTRGEDDGALSQEVHAALREVRGQPAR